MALSDKFYIQNRICNNEPEDGRVDSVLTFDGTDDGLFAELGMYLTDASFSVLARTLGGPLG